MKKVELNYDMVKLTKSKRNIFLCTLTSSLKGLQGEELNDVCHTCLGTGSNGVNYEEN